ncbi:hypothetical protein PR048_004137 [Dryococelus australis]|uniref:Uncharacterized protein n=1 Tax=Dryococelus australis TaxID=614101 RepID=A0ABQ9I5T2_9NEOP|nr:hypothetical protein PR048_004137 [Dryococelus australis]
MSVRGHRRAYGQNDDHHTLSRTPAGGSHLHLRRLPGPASRLQPRLEQGNVALKTRAYSAQLTWVVPRVP